MRKSAERCREPLFEVAWETRGATHAGVRTCAAGLALVFSILFGKKQNIKLSTFSRYKTLRQNTKKMLTILNQRN